MILGDFWASFGALFDQKGDKKYRKNSRILNGAFGAFLPPMGRLLESFWTTFEVFLRHGWKSENSVPVYTGVWFCEI